MRFLELRHGAALANPAQRTAVLAAARIFRILLRQLGEISARLQLLQDVFRLLARLLHALGINFSIRRQAAES